MASAVGWEAQLRRMLNRLLFFIELLVIFTSSRVGKGISAQASHRTVLAPLNAHGSCRSVHEVKNHKQYWAMLYHPIFYNGCIG